MKATLFVYFFIPLLIACNGQRHESAQQGLLKDTTALPLAISVSSNSNIKTIHIKNLSADTLKYYIGMEMWIDNEWGEIILDVNPKAPEKGAILKKIAPSKDTIYKCALMQILPPFYKIDTGRYRFKINYGSSPGNVIKEMQTVEFTLNK